MGFGRLLLAAGYLSTPFAGPGSAVLTSAGWLAYGAEERRPLYAWIGLVGLAGVAAIVAGKNGYGGEGVAGLGGVLVLLYYILSIAAIWLLGIRQRNTALQVAAVALAVGWLLAAPGAAAAQQAAPAAAVDWGGVAWASQAAGGLLAAIGGTGALAKALTALGAVFAALGFLSAQPGQGALAEGEEAVFRLGVY